MDGRVDRKVGDLEEKVGKVGVFRIVGERFGGCSDKNVSPSREKSRVQIKELSVLST